MFKNDNFNNFVQFFINKLLMPLLCLFILIMCLIIFATTSQAASLPYYVDNDNFEWNGFSVNDIQSYINQKFINDQAPQYSVDLINNVTLIYQGYENNVPYLAIYTKSNTQNTNYAFGNWSIGIQNFDTDIDTVTCSFTKCYRILLKLNTNNTLGWKTWYPNQAQSFTLFGTGYYPLYINGLFYDNISVSGVISQGENVVLTNIADNLIDVGVAIIPPSPITPEYLNGLTPPSSVPPSYTINNYTWTTQPTFDNSSTLDAIGSIKDFIVWLANNISGEFQNLISNLQGFFTYIGDTIQYYGNIIIDTLNNFIQNFYDNMSSLVQPIFEKIAYITEDFNADEVNAALNNTSFIGIKNQFFTFFTTFESAFDISEPNTFTLTINIQNIDTFYNFGCRSPVIIHLDEHFTPIKTALRTFLWIFISFGTVFIVERGLSDWLRGENDTK